MPHALDRNSVTAVTLDFVERLVERFPGLEPIFVEHLTDNFGVALPHVFFGDITRYIISRFIDVGSAVKSGGSDAERDVRAIMNALEEAYTVGDEEIQELISVSFLEHLPRPGEAAANIRAWLGPELMAQLQVIG